MSKFIGRRRHKFDNLSLTIPVATVMFGAVGVLSTDTGVSAPAAGRNFRGHLMVAVTDEGPTLAQHVLPLQWNIPVKTGLQATVERWLEFEVEGDDYLLQTGTNSIGASQAFGTLLTHVAGKLQVAVTTNTATHEVLASLTPETAGNKRLRVRELTAFVVVA